MPERPFPSPSHLLAALKLITDNQPVFVDVGRVVRRLAHEGFKLSYSHIVAMATCSIAGDGGPIFQVQFAEHQVLIREVTKLDIKEDTEGAIRAVHAVNAPELWRNEIRRWTGEPSDSTCRCKNVPAKKRILPPPPPTEPCKVGSTKAKVRPKPNVPPAYRPGMDTGMTV